MEYLHEDHYFSCTYGLMPSQLQSTQKVMIYESKHYYLTTQSRATHRIADFGCKWAVVLAGIIAGLAALTGGALLIALGAGIIGGGLLCGIMLAGTRNWVKDKHTVTIGNIEMLTMRAHMECPYLGGKIFVEPGVTSEWQAWALMGRNSVLAFGEGFLIGWSAKSIFAGGSAFSLSALKTPMFWKNFAFLHGTASTIGVADQVIFEGMIRRDKSLGDSFSDHALDGALVLEMPFINVVQKARGKVLDEDGNPVPLGFDDFYNLVLGILGARTVIKASAGPHDIPKETWNAVRDFTSKVKGIFKGKAYELAYRQDSNPYSNQGKTEGRIKSYIDADGNLIPANKNGRATVQDHIRGSEPRKSDSPYTSFSKDTPSPGKVYGDKTITVDLTKLEADIQSGKVKNVEVLRPEEVQAEMQQKVNDAQEKYNDNPSKKNQERLDNAKRDLENTSRDNEVLIKGEIPGEYIEVKPTK